MTRNLCSFAKLFFVCLFPKGQRFDTRDMNEWYFGLKQTFAEQHTAVLETLTHSCRFTPGPLCSSGLRFHPAARCGNAGGPCWNPAATWSSTSVAFRWVFVSVCVSCLIRSDSDNRMTTHVDSLLIAVVDRVWVHLRVCASVCWDVYFFSSDFDFLVLTDLAEIQKCAAQRSAQTDRFSS